MYDTVKVGDRIALTRTDDPHTKLQPGDEGTVMSVRKAGAYFTGSDVVSLEVGVVWDSGSGLTMIEDAGDSFRILS